jgi:hypothetical protein
MGVHPERLLDGACNVLERAIAGSLNLGLYQDGQQAGFARGVPTPTAGDEADRACDRAGVAGDLECQQRPAFRAG